MQRTGHVEILDPAPIARMRLYFFYTVAKKQRHLDVC